MEQGETTSFAATPKYYVPAKYTALTVRSSGPVFVEGIEGNWYGESYGEFYGVSIGVKSSKIYFVEGSAGVVHLTNFKSNNLNGNDQFTYAAAFGKRFDNMSLSLKVRHFSNANTKGTNYGMDFKLINLLIEF